MDVITYYDDLVALRRASAVLMEGLESATGAAVSELKDGIRRTEGRLRAALEATTEGELEEVFEVLEDEARVDLEAIMETNTEVVKRE